MTSRYAQIANHIAWARNSGGYLRSCRSCGVLIYLHRAHDEVWRPYASWVAGDAAQGEWQRHNCGAVEQDSSISEREAIAAEQELLGEMLQQISPDDKNAASARAAVAQRPR